MADTIEIYAGKDINLTVPVRDSSGNAVTSYTVLDTPICEVWDGDDTAVLFTPTTVWTDAPTGVVQTSISAANTASLSSGRYAIHYYILVSDGRKVEAARGWLKLIDSPGTATAPKTYCSYNDLEKYAGDWLDNLAGKTTQGSFLEERGRARTKLEEIIQAHQSNSVGTNPVLQGYLDDDKLMVTPKVKDICALYALAIICKRQVSPSGKEDGYQVKAKQYEAEADSLVNGYVAELDLNADGYADWRIDCGSWDIRR